MAEYDAATALVVVDMQNDFADRAGGLAVRGGDAVVQPVNREIGRARSAGALVVLTQDWHPESTPHFAKDGGIWPVHCVQETWGAELHPALLAVQGPVVRKGTQGEDGYSGFSTRDPTTGETRATDLQRELKERGVRRVVVVGLATDYCVMNTALDALRNGFSVTVDSNAVRPVEVEPGDGERALAEVRAAGGAVR